MKKIKNDYLQECKRIDETIDSLSSEIYYLSAEYQKLERQLQNAKASVRFKYFLANLIAVLVFPVIVLLFSYLANGPSNLDISNQLVMYVGCVVIVAIANLAHKASQDSGGNTLVTRTCKLLNMGNISTLEHDLYSKKNTLYENKKRLEELQQERQTLEQEKG